MDHHPSRAKASTFSKRKNCNNLPSKPKSPFSNNDVTVIWSNLAFVADTQSSVGSNIVFSCPSQEEKNKRREFFSMPITEEELKIRDELAKEIEKELEREIMEGILVLVHRLSDLKAKQIIHGFKDFHLRLGDQWEGLLQEISTSSKSHNPCNSNGYRK